MNYQFNHYLDTILSVGIDDNCDYVKKQQIRNTNKGALIAFVFGTLCTLSTIRIVPTPYIYVPLVMCFLYPLSIFFNYFQKYNLANLSIWLLSNLLFFWLANAYGKSSNAYMLFVIAEMVSILNLDFKKKESTFIISTVPILLAFITFATDFSLVNIPTITEKHQQLLSPLMFFMVLIGSGLAVWVYRQNLFSYVKNLEKIQNDLQAKYKELEHVNEDLSKANEELDRFVYSVSHDLRAPITSVMGLLDLCETDAQNLKTYLSLQRKSINKLDNFIKDILHYARNSRMEIKPIKIDFAHSLQEIFEEQCHSQAAQNLDFQVEVLGNSHVYTDDFRFKIIASNLISNAIRYRKENTPSSFIHIQIFLTEKEVKMVFSDNGIGISPKYLPFIFQMFYRANTKSTGSGLGLYIVKEALNKMNGTIKVESVEEEGTTFTVIMPNLGKPEVSEPIAIPSELEVTH